MKALDKLIEILPLPFIAAISVLILATWLIKEWRNYNRYGDTFRDKYWRASIVIIFTIICMYYSVTMIFSRLPPFTFSPDDYAILVSKFEGDLENLVQRQIVERLRTSVYHDSALKKIRIEPLKIQIYERDQAVNILRKTKAQTLIWESFIPKR